MQTLFLAFEGIDGSGKSTQAALLQKQLLLHYTQVHLTAEPTKEPIGKMLRTIFSGAMPAEHSTIAALFAADRLEHIHNNTNGMLSLLKQGIPVITDRYYLSSYAYHSVHVPMPWVIELNKLAVKALPPAAHIFIDIPAEVAMQRITANRTSTELYETLDNLIAVRNNYLQAINLIKDTETVIVIDGVGTEEQVANKVWQAVQTFL
jgi:dTMP kinase